MIDLQDRRVLITGGCGDIGKATARRFLAQGASVLITDLKEEDLKAAKAELESDRCHTFAADVTQPDQVEAYVQAATEKMGGIDVFFNNAGVEGPVAGITKYSIEEFRQVVDVNIMGVWFGLRYVMAAMREAGNGGSIIITSSVAGQNGSPGTVAYTASKHAVVGMMKVAALEGAKHGIRVNTIHPSPVEGRMMNSLEAGMGKESKVTEQLKGQIPLGRYAERADVAKLVLFLASDAASFLTGGQFNVDGGMSAK